ncbi:unnamed protein product [Linum trigynum]|uniref:Thionin-like protein n=1 Tax=Linum trigynum TaxID=586398 RepID=A0AAV2EIS4_9ROSI
MEKKKAVLVVMLLSVLLLCHADVGGSAAAQDLSPYDCYDVCTTFCVQYAPDARRMSRCEIKCGIECDG